MAVRDAEVGEMAVIEHVALGGSFKSFLVLEDLLFISKNQLFLFPLILSYYILFLLFWG